MDDELLRAAAAKDNAYRERDQLVAALSKAFPSHLCKHPADDADWEDDWRTIVCVHLPTGQATWHVHDTEYAWFTHLTWSYAHYDGHTTPEKYERLNKLSKNWGWAAASCTTS